MRQWKNETYRENANMLYDVRHIGAADRELCNSVLVRLGVMDKAMDGSSAQGLPAINEGSVPIIFSDVMHRMLDGYISPMGYVLSLVLECTKQGVTNTEEVAGIVGRGLRALPSFFREVDLREKLAAALPNAKVKSVSANQDVADHTDVVVTYGVKLFRIWSYQCTTRGLQNTSHRLLGKRGELLDGLHVLCPFDMQDKSQLTDLCGWYLHSNSYINKVVAVITGEAADDYADVCAMPIDLLKNTYMKEVHVILKTSQSAKEAPKVSVDLNGYVDYCSIGNFCKKINDTMGLEKGERLVGAKLNQQLIDEGYLEVRDCEGVQVKLPTALGMESGIVEAKYLRKGEPVIFALYNPKAQRMLLEKFVAQS